MQPASLRGHQERFQRKMFTECACPLTLSATNVSVVFTCCSLCLAHLSSLQGLLVSLAPTHILGFRY